MKNAAQHFWILTVAASLVATGSADRITKQGGRIVAPARSKASAQNPVVTALRIHPNGKWMVSAGDDHAVRIWDIKTGKQLNRLEGHRDWVDTAAFSPDGNLLVTAGNDHRMIIWNLSTGQRTSMRPVGARAISALAFNHQGNRVAIVGFDRSIGIYDVVNRRLVQELKAPCQDMRCVTFSNDDRHLVGGGRNGRIGVYDVASGERLGVFKAHQQRIRAIIFDDDDRQIITAGEDRFIRVWDCETLQLISEISTGKSKTMSMVSLGGDRIAAGGSDNRVAVWNLVSGKRDRSFVGHTGSVVALDHKDGVLVSGSFDTTVRVWSVAATRDGDPTKEKEIVTRDVRHTRK